MTSCSPPEHAPRTSLLREVVSFLVMLAVISILLTFLATRFVSGGVPWSAVARVFLLNLTFGGIIGGIMWSLYTWGFARVAGRNPSRLRYLGTHALFIGVGCAAGLELALRILAVVPWGRGVHFDRAETYQVAYVIGTVLVLVFTTIERWRNRATESERRLEEARQQALRAQLEALQARTNPHFLFNSLNTVAGLIEEDPRRAEDVLERFSDLLRYSLAGARKQRVPLAEELDVARGYLEVEGIRLGPRLRTEITVQEGIENTPVPPLLLQPLVENAVLHGVAPRVEGGRVRLRARRANGRLEVTVEDDGPGAAPVATAPEPPSRGSGGVWSWPTGTPPSSRPTAASWAGSGCGWPCPSRRIPAGLAPRTGPRKEAAHEPAACSGRGRRAGRPAPADPDAGADSGHGGGG